jgi:hypothetical protein
MKTRLLLALLAAVAFGAWTMTTTRGGARLLPIEVDGWSSRRTRRIRKTARSTWKVAGPS